MADFPFWNFSIDRYGRKDVPALCLHLQATHHVDVNALLFALWAGHQGRAITAPEGLDLIEDAVGSWHRTFVVPLRHVRQQMKDWPTTSQDAQDALRKKVKSAELDAEKLEQRMLQTLWDTSADQLTSDASDQDPQMVMLQNVRLYVNKVAAEGAPNADQALLEFVALCEGGTP